MARKVLYPHIPKSPMGVTAPPVPVLKIPRLIVKRAGIPPAKMTVDEFREQWQSLGWHMIIIGPTATWRQEWGVWEAIREIVQNSLDETETYQWGYDDQGLWIGDNGKGIAVANFLLGPTKLKPDYARGKYGEGMKIGALALLRLGYRVRVETGNREVWLLFIEQEADGLVETLGALWKEKQGAGTKFHIIGYTGPAYEGRFAVNLPRDRILWQSPSTVSQPRMRYNQIIKKVLSELPAIYARDIFMRDIETLGFSYNLWGFDLAPDRFAPSKEDDMWKDVSRTWACVRDLELLKEFMRMVKEPADIQAYESNRFRFNHWDMGFEAQLPNQVQRSYIDIAESNKEQWLRAWYDVMGNGAVLQTSETFDGLVQHLGYKAVTVAYGVRDGLATLVSTDRQLVEKSQERLQGAQIIKDDKLPAKESQHLTIARRLTSISTANPKAVYAAIIPPASDRVRTAGMYQKSTREVFISMQELTRLQSTISVLIHELAHNLSGADDLTDDHANAITLLAGEMVNNVQHGKIDELLTKDVVW